MDSHYAETINSSLKTPNVSKKTAPVTIVIVTIVFLMMTAWRIYYDLNKTNTKEFDNLFLVSFAFFGQPLWVASLTYLLTTVVDILPFIQGSWCIPNRTIRLIVLLVPLILLGIYLLFCVFNLYGRPVGLSLTWFLSHSYIFSIVGITTFLGTKRSDVSV